ncbi:MAG TPA: 3-hydroxy-5-phosphonooxypentane-2,4-dione thiolase [Thermodesulfovibrionales bacterium]|jgi:putative autoinducer-2 (AI-2) aldolase|nr:3-hydroxy-5-phosphonooxypentane-2,4-dione thiolase [Thermodesulfovibrionales bacterium]
MDWGLKNRLSRIIKPDGKTVMLAVDHGYFLGPTTGLEDAGKTIKPLLPYADALMPTRGIVRTSVDPSSETPIVLRVSGGNSILDEDLSYEGITVSMEDAVRLNVAAVAISIYVGSPNQKETLLNLARLINEGQRYGVPVLAVTAVGKNMGKDVRYLALACRIAAELGAHFVKTYYCEGFEKVVKTCPVPVVMAGGKKLPEPEALELTYNAIRRGAAGVDMGRNIFQSEAPVAMIQAVRAVVHEGAKPREAHDIFNSLKSAKAKEKRPKMQGATASREELSRH